MAKERLSKLQKWILVKAYTAEKYLPRSDIYKDYYGLRAEFRKYRIEYSEKQKRKAKNAYVVVCNSLKNLKMKGLIETYFNMTDSEPWEGLGDHIGLTKKGKTLIEKLNIKVHLN